MGLTTTEQESEDLKRQLQKLKGEDGQYVISTFGSVYGLPALIDFIRTEVLKARIDELDHAFIHNAPAFADEIDIEKYWNNYYEIRFTKLQANQKEGEE